MRRSALSLMWVLIVGGVLAVIALSFAAPRRMLSPGPLISAHGRIEADCFACHAPWRGAAWQRCTQCHRLPDIGLRTTHGVALTRRRSKVPFHQELIEQDCMACHTDHAGDHVADHAGGERNPFSHAMLRAAVRTVCEGCHAAPADTTHGDLTVGCGRCHRTQRWEPADFDHAALAPIEQQHCEGCHRPPSDDLHQVLPDQCQRCHSQKHWKPATFDHAKVFVLDADHSADHGARCSTCHLNRDVRHFTCYGCHAHQPDRIRAVHMDEGIRDFADCVRCHRNPGQEPQGGERD
ncbi:MAG TPA: cytochrome c3 family protein [Burkholderiaceae bacterium]|nr:cytochrome c3 family protein [Burkholderiaceae bacterium]